jgi:hypothetical protein
MFLALCRNFTYMRENNILRIFRILVIVLISIRRRECDIKDFSDIYVSEFFHTLTFLNWYLRFKLKVRTTFLVNL